MAISISFDSNNRPIEPTLVLMNRSGEKLGAIPAYNINATDNLNSYSELFFAVDKVDAENIWDNIVDFKLVWVREWNQVYEIYVEYKESQGLVKNVTAKSLGHAELSQINIYGLNANNETDIENDDTRTVLYNASDASHSLLNRIIGEKAGHYSINHVDTWIRNIQRTFEFDNISILDAFTQIAEEIDCIFIIDTSIDGTTNSLVRKINVYDLEYYCSGSNCNYRGTFTDTCPNCGGTNILPGYGDDTTIFVSADNLSDEIDLSVDTDSVKNCFKLEAGDDLMTATIRNCNPNGSDYLWYITDEVKADMPSNLVEKLNEYDELYNFYVTDSAAYLEVATPVAANLSTYYEKSGTTYTLTADTAVQSGKTYYIKNDISLNATKVSAYNTLVNSYHTTYSTLSTITTPISGYSNLMNKYYDVIDFSMLLNDSMMPTPSITGTISAESQIALITSSALNPVAVTSLETVSTSTATSAILAIAKTLIDDNYSLSATASADIVKTRNASNVVTSATWTGIFKATSYSDEDDVYTGSAITVTLSDSTVDYTKQRILKLLNSDDNDSDNQYGIVALFNKTLSNFTAELKKYSLSCLNILSDCAQGCLDVLISMGAANSSTWYDDELNDDDTYDSEVSAVSYSGSSSTGGTVNYYRSFYKPYYKRFIAIQTEVQTRESEVATIEAMMDEINTKVAEIQAELNFEDYLGSTLWNVFSSYRRDDVYSNENFISDGLNNAELFTNAREFLVDAQKEIYKSATLQHSITATLVNLLALPEFSPIVDYFKVGNWIRVRIEDDVYKLRLLSYSVDYENLNNITVQFSDITKVIDGMSDVESILNSASSMATSYDYVKRQSKKGLASNEQLAHWVEDGLSLTNMRIVNTADEQNILIDDHGLLAKEYLPVTDEYDDKQLKIINRGLYVTNDNWRTSKAGIGDFLFYDPEEQEVVEGYGVIADTIVGKIILGEEVGIYNTEGSVTIDKNGLQIVADLTEDDTTDTMFKVQRKVTDTTAALGYKTEDLLSLNSDGSMVLNGELRVNTSSGDKLSDLVSNDDLDDALEDYYTISNIDTVFTTANEENITSSVGSHIIDSARALKTYTNTQLNNRFAAVDAYMEMTSTGLKIGALSGSSSNFYTLINNVGMEFCTGETTVAYITKDQLYINNATINDRLMVGNYFFCPQEDGGMTIVWVDDE